MPYIKQEERKNLDQWIESLCVQLFINNDVGEYNYVITKLIHNYIKENGLKYRHLNNAVGILECAKAEFIRTVVSPYEKQKLISNGSVSELDQGK